jgi:hypothetical protein
MKDMAMKHMPGRIADDEELKTRKEERKNKKEENKKRKWLW